ncbi:MAG: AAA family ATPase [Desulfobacterales bacterium]|nr:AAA family ATPase [Deltaproteobacteria bacterium]NNK85130.1 AAA family ATPase [Desulfobacterales bacterium]NNL43473.1 AAA family ATPase [Desulfobacterales bacterium]
MVHLKGINLSLENCPTGEYYPFNLRIFQEECRLEFISPVTFFTGENGTGKSSLLQAMAEKCRIHIWEGIETTRFESNPYEGMLHKFVSVYWSNGSVPGSYFDSEISKNFAQYLDEWAASDPGILEYFGGKSLMTQSHGQSLMSFFKARYRFKGIYFLDEPETALSPKSQLELLQVLKQNSEAGHAQFIIATHSPILMACPGATIYSFDEIPVSQIDYEKTEHFRIYRDFMVNRSKYL